MLQVIPSELDFFVHLGETVQGPARANGSSYDLLTNDPLEQAMIAEDLLKPIVDRVKPHSSGVGKACWVLRGSNWHEGDYGREADRFARTMGAQPNPTTLEPAGDILDVEIAGYVCNFAHHHPVFQVYLSTPLEREINWFHQSEPQVEGGRWPDLIMRGHTHRYRLVETEQAIAVACPAWQLATRYVVRKDVARAWGQLGFVLVYLDETAKERGRRGIWTEAILYQYPKRRMGRL